MDANTTSYSKDDIEKIMELMQLGIRKIIVVYDLKVYTHELTDTNKTVGVLQSIYEKKDPSIDYVYTTDKSYMETPSSLLIELYHGIEKCVAIVYLVDEDGNLYGDPLVKNFTSVADLLGC